MLHAFMGQCVPCAAFLPVLSLNEPVASNELDDADDASEEVVDRVADPTPNVEEDLHHKQLIASVRGFVRGLSPNLRKIVILHYWLGYSQSEIAVMLGVTRSAVCHALNRVNRLGREHLGAPAV